MQRFVNYFDRSMADYSDYTIMDLSNKDILVWLTTLRKLTLNKRLKVGNTIVLDTLNPAFRILGRNSNNDNNYFCVLSTETSFILC